MEPPRTGGLEGTEEEGGGAAARRHSERRRDAEISEMLHACQNAPPWVFRGAAAAAGVRRELRAADARIAAFEDFRAELQRRPWRGADGGGPTTSAQRPGSSAVT
jgi:hypothetical protein|eukprot:COSAG01_NODE_506_length_16125_cov_5.130912_10_plen_105_part_00